MPSDLFVNLHPGPEMPSFIVPNLGNGTPITRNLPRVPPLESAYFRRQSASSRIKLAAPWALYPGMALHESQATRNCNGHDIE